MSQTSIAASAPAPLSNGRPSRHNTWAFPKEYDGKLTANFSIGEFRCRCAYPECHLTLISPRLVDVLQTLRELLATPLNLSSAYRCLRHNAAAGGGLKSFHTWGMAADVICRSESMLTELGQQARIIPLIGGIGHYHRSGFAHIDVRTRTADGKPHTWSA